VGLLSYGLLFLCGAYAIQLLQRLPADVWWLVAVPATILCLALRSLRPVGVLLLGFLLIWASSRQVIQQRLAVPLVGKDLTEVFQVIDFAKQSGATTSLVVRPIESGKLPTKIRLSWYDAAAIPALGECWSLTVRLRRPRGFSNPVGFDYEGWLFRQEIGATGYVRDGVRESDCSGYFSLARLRRHLAARISATLPDDDATAVVLAITVGARHRISPSQWRRYAITGTSHLMAISGLHIGLAAGGGFLLSWVLLALFNRSGNLRDQAGVVALFLATGYAAIAGFALPAQRALVMLALVLLATLWRRSVSPAWILAVTCIAMTVASPLAILTPGFQLSFAAVGILLWLARLYRVSDGSQLLRHRLRRALGEFMPMQIALLLGLLPLTATLFGRVSWLAPWVNLIVLPVFNLVTVPASLLGLLLAGPLQPLGDALLRVGWYSVTLLLALVEAAAGIPRAELRIAGLQRIALLSVWLTVVWVFLPVSWPGRKLAWLAGLGAILQVAPRPPPGCVDIHALDVGQGLAAVVITHSHTLVYDTGPSFRSGSDTGALVVAPFLQQKGIDEIDLLVVSHGDNDHAGGVSSLLAEVRTGALLSGEYLPDLPMAQSLCATGQGWQWDGVQISVLHPPSGKLRAGNNASCVLEIRTGGSQALLTGDIELAAESMLVRERQLSPTQLVFVPHHGSRTSSHAAFIDRLRPQVALVWVSTIAGGFPRKISWSAGARVMRKLPIPPIAAHFRIVCAVRLDCSGRGPTGSSSGASGTNRPGDAVLGSILQPVTVYFDFPRGRAVWSI